MQITFIRDSGPDSETYNYASERAAVQAIQAGVGISPQTGNWDAATTTALVAALNDPSGYFAAYPDLRDVLSANIRAAQTAGVADASQVQSALTVALSQWINSPIARTTIGPQTFTIPLGVVAPGVAAPPAPPAPPRPPAPPGPPAPPPPPTEEKLLGLPKNVVIGVGIGAGVLVLGGLVLLALGGPAPARASGKARRR